MIIRFGVSNNHASPPRMTEIVSNFSGSGGNQKNRLPCVFFKCRPRQFIRQGKVPSTKGEAVQVQSPIGGKRCLVLDDEFLIALDIQQILERAGALHVACVATAAEAIKLLGDNPKFDIAILDVKLNGSNENSLGVASLLTALDTPFVFLTGMRVNDMHAKRFPQAPVIEKPYEASALLAAVGRALSRV